MPRCKASLPSPKRLRAGRRNPFVGAIHELPLQDTPQRRLRAEALQRAGDEGPACLPVGWGNAADACPPQAGAFFSSLSDILEEFPEWLDECRVMKRVKMVSPLDDGQRFRLIKVYIKLL